MLWVELELSYSDFCIIVHSLLCPHLCIIFLLLLCPHPCILSSLLLTFHLCPILIHSLLNPHLLDSRIIYSLSLTILHSLIVHY